MFDYDVNVNIPAARMETSVRGGDHRLGAMPGTTRADDVPSAPAAGRCRAGDPPT